MNIAESAKILGFTANWFNSGMIDDNTFNTVLSEFNSSEDKYSEHYRFGVFRQYMNSHNVLTAENIEDIYNIALNDPDRFVGQAMTGDIVKLPSCPNYIIEEVAGLNIKYLDKTIKELNKKCQR